MNPNHYLKQVSSGADQLEVDGEYFSLAVRRIVLAADIVTDRILRRTASATLVEVSVANRQEYRMPSGSEDALLIDSDGYQHSRIYLDHSASILSSSRLPSETPLPSPAYEIEGRARTKGWIAFPQLEDGAVPHRFIYKHDLFAPGESSGSVLGTETLELVFDLSVFQRILDERTNESA